MRFKTKLEHSWLTICWIQLVVRRRGMTDLALVDVAILPSCYRCVISTGICNRQFPMIGMPFLRSLHAVSENNFQFRQIL